MEKTRDYLFDNMKGILIFLVVFGHLIEYFVFKIGGSIDYIYTGIYLFHMPVFVFISGYFSKKHKEKKILELVFVYILWQAIIYPLFLSITLDIPFSEYTQSLFNPRFTYWYIFSLITWKIITPYFSKIKFNLLVSIVLGLLIGYSSINSSMGNFSLGRTISFYPFFLVGYYCTREQFYYYKNKLNKYIGFIAFISVIILGIVFINSLDDLVIKEKYINKALFLKDKYEKYLRNEDIGFIIRSILYSLQFMCIYLFTTFISSKKSIFSKIGQNTLFIYLSHAVLIKYLQKTYFKSVPLDSSMILITALVLSFAYCLLLSSKPFVKFGSIFTNINMNLFLKKDTNNNKKSNITNLSNISSNAS